MALVTGAAGGIGGAIVDRLIKAGYAVVAGDVQPFPHESAAVHPMTLDVRSTTAWRQLSTRQRTSVDCAPS